MTRATEKQHRPFSCGSQFMDWKARNCRECIKGYDDDAQEWAERWRCDLEREIDFAGTGDGSVPAAIARRLGCFQSELGYPAQDCPERVS